MPGCPGITGSAMVTVGSSTGGSKVGLTIGLVLGGVGVALLGYALVRPESSFGFFGRFPLLLTGGILAFQGLVWLLVYAGSRGNAKRKGDEAARLVQTGLKATVRVAAVADTGISINDNPRVQLTLEVYPEWGAAPYTVTKSVTVSRLAVPRVGETAPALVDPQDPTKLIYGAQVPALLAQGGSAAYPEHAPPPPSAWG